jgi:aspartate aminotransferase
MPAQVAPSALAVPYSRIRELGEIALGMEGVLKLYFGESNLATPDFIKRAAGRALAEGYTFYTGNAGLPSLRQALANYYRQIHAVEIDPASEIAVTASGVEALSISLRCLVDPGDEALVLTPAWPNGMAILRMAHAVVKEIPHPLRNEGTPGARYEIDFDALERAVTPRTRLLLYTSPSNPLGWVATESDQERLLDFTRRHGLWLVADEVYERLYYGRPARLVQPYGASSSASPESVAEAHPNAVPSILRKADRQDAVIVVQSFSKAWCMTGWRLGWLAGRRDLIARAAELNEYMISCAAAFTQKAGEAALAEGEEFVCSMAARLRENRDFCLSALRAMPGVSTPVPDGAFYLFPSIEAARDSFAFCKRLLLETKVGLAPGSAFGAGGEGRVRLCYASEQPILEEALARLGEFLKSRC